MRELRKHGSFVGAAGWFLLAATNTEMMIADVKKKTCRDCGLLLGEHTIVEGAVFCPAGTLPAEGAEMVVGGEHWNELDAALKENAD